MRVMHKLRAESSILAPRAHVEQLLGYQVGMKTKETHFEPNWAAAVTPGRPSKKVNSLSGFAVEDVRQIAGKKIPAWGGLGSSVQDFMGAYSPQLGMMPGDFQRDFVRVV